LAVGQEIPGGLTASRPRAIFESRRPFGCALQFSRTPKRRAVPETTGPLRTIREMGPVPLGRLFPYKVKTYYEDGENIINRERAEISRFYRYRSHATRPHMISGNSRSRSARELNHSFNSDQGSSEIANVPNSFICCPAIFFLATFIFFARSLLDTVISLSSF
jgi:hypothetical protein